jgi:heptosyltransferase-2
MAEDRRGDPGTLRADSQERLTPIHFAMNKIELLKKVDKILGTPVCCVLGVMDRFLFRRNEIPPSYQRILITKLVAIGDLVCCLPTVRAIKGSFPQSHLAILVTPRVREVVEGCSYLDEIIYYDIFGKDAGLRGFIRTIKKLRRKKFDLVIELDHYYRITTLISHLAAIKNKAGFDLPNQGRRHLYTIKVPYALDKHEVETFLGVAEQIGANALERELVEIWVSPEDQEYVSQFLAGEGVNSQDVLVCIHPGTGPSATSRRWKPERFASVADWLMEEFDAKVILTGVASEIELVNRIAELMTKRPIIAAGKTNLKQLAEIARRCRLFISVDTGPLHIAAAMKTKVIGLYGPNTPVKWGPYGDGHIVIYKGLACSPCTKQYLGQVSKCTNPICMDGISVEDVKAAVSRML